MPNQIRKVIILGSGAIKIGEAGEFDYSGSQAIKALKDEGITAILVNPNIATIQTSDYLADQIYFLPVTIEFVSDVIEKERPDGILLGFGGQTALQCGIDLEDSGILGRYGVRVLGTPIRTIKETEDRDLFVKRLSEIGVKVPVSAAVKNIEQAVHFAEEIGFPVMIRVGYALGGLGSGVCGDAHEVQRLAAKALSHSPQLLIEEYLAGWKEIEYEVVRDSADNCITVCNMENLDPMGIHTGESIVVAPSQTLNNAEYHKLRQIAIQVVRHLGIIGECNIQYALDPKSDDYRVIEVNARLSRSSALASKATGYPLAYVAAKLGIGYSMTDIVNDVTGVTKACYEPALDYVVVKAPRWDFQKFQKVSRKIGSGMKSVGEVMAIGRTFEEALQKAIRMLKTGACGLVANDHLKFNNVESELKNPSHERIFAIVEALKNGHSIEQIHNLSLIDKWFLYKIQKVCELSGKLSAINHKKCPFDLLQKAKQLGFSDYQIARLSGITEDEIRRQREKFNLYPYVKQIDTLAAEYPARTNYLYLTYNGQEHDIEFGEKNQVIILGSGAYSIGSSVEFDWCCVNTAVTLRKLGYQTIIINYNPETVSTDYSESDKLYFEDLNLETVLEIIRMENPLGVITSMGGQIPNNLALKLHRAGVEIIGTSALSIDNAEDRKKFSRLLDELNIKQPEWTEAESPEAAELFAKQVGYPVLVRPSYVLSGAAMGVASNSAELKRVLQSAAEVSVKYPVVVSKYIEKAKELDIDAVARAGEIVVWAVSEHVENAGVHSGDATLVHPPQRTYLETIKRIKRVTYKIAKALNINGPFNIQFIAKGNQVSVIECNLRASRSLPFVSKIQKINFIDRATRVLMGHEVTFSDNSFFDLEYVGVKAPQFSFMRLDDADPALGVEMASTGEVACLGDDFEEAFLKALLAVGYRFPVKSMFLSTGPVYAKAAFIDHIKKLKKEGIKLYATKGTADFLSTHGIDTFVLKWPLEKESPNALEYISNGDIDMVINIPKNYHEDELTNDYLIRRQAVDHGIPLITNIQLAQRFVEAIFNKRSQDLSAKSWAEYKMDYHAYREISKNNADKRSLKIECSKSILNL